MLRLLLSALINCTREEMRQFTESDSARLQEAIRGKWGAHSCRWPLRHRRVSQRRRHAPGSVKVPDCNTLCTPQAFLSVLTRTVNLTHQLDELIMNPVINSIKEFNRLAALAWTCLASLWGSNCNPAGQLTTNNWMSGFQECKRTCRLVNIPHRWRIGLKKGTFHRSARVLWTTLNKKKKVLQLLPTLRTKAVDSFDSRLWAELGLMLFSCLECYTKNTIVS